MQIIFEQGESPWQGIAVKVHCGDPFTRLQVSVVQGLLSLQTRPPWTTHFPDVGTQIFSPHCPLGTGGQVKAVEAVQTQTPFTLVGVTVAHLFGGQRTGVMTQVPFKQTFGLQGSVDTQPDPVAQLFAGLQPGIGVKTQFPVDTLQEANVQGFELVQTFGVLKQPATRSQLAVLHKSGGLQIVVVDLQVLDVGSQALVMHLFEAWVAQITVGLRTHCCAVWSQALVVQPFGAGGQTTGV